MPARKKISKARASKKTAKTATRKKAAVRKPASKAKASTAAPKPGSKEEHYADLRRVALANALNRIR
jgi:hypothetical protein